MRYEDVVALRKHSSAWRLLRADNAPLVLSFLHRIFVEGNARSVTAAELISQLDDELYALNERLEQLGWLTGPDGRVVAVEVKLARTVNSSDTTHLRWLRDRLGDQSPTPQ